ncbi:MAG: hypothetical protein J6R88_02190 [Clostridia bacterium]|nr:hypothetical protein [Clostridia bacterium]
MKDCVLYDRECIECGECNYCDLVEDKLCDNCGKCLESDGEYNAVKITKIYTDKTTKKQ